MFSVGAVCTLILNRIYPTQDAQCCNSFGITKSKDDKFYLSNNQINNPLINLSIICWL
jgi:hypothetical protein